MIFRFSQYYINIELHFEAWCKPATGQLETDWGMSYLRFGPVYIVWHRFNYKRIR